MAAGVTWTCVVASAPWAARLGHTSVIDAAGAIYVIGGEDRSVLDDVWASATGGGGRNSCRGTRRVLQGCYWYSTSSHGCSAVLGSCLEKLKGTIGVRFGALLVLTNSKGTRRALEGAQGVLQGVLKGVPRGAQGGIQVVLSGSHAASLTLEGHSIGALGTLGILSAWHGTF